MLVGSGSGARLGVLCSSLSIKEDVEHYFWAIEEVSGHLIMLCVFIEHAVKALRANLVNPRIWIGHEYW